MLPINKLQSYMEQNIINNYTQAAALAKQEADKYKKLANTYSLLRLGIFGLMIFSVYLTITQDNFSIMAVAFVVLLAAFAWLVGRQGEYERQRNYYLDLERINLNEVNSLQSNSNLYNNGQRYSNEKHFYSSDLDIFGNASLYNLINRTATSTGNDKLAEWLNTPADKPTVLSRQQAVQEIAANNDWKVNTQTKLLFATKEDTDQMKRLFVYLSTPLELPGEQWLKTYIKIAPFLLFGILLAGVFLYPVFKLVAIA
ncbi:hypothetical protein QN344_08275, partial [Mucilaginibacter sp. 5B2]|nr:hypothetical protein [Mucilaginibacter sp. 5B2]